MRSKENIIVTLNFINLWFMADIFQTEIKFLPGVGPKRAELLSKELNIETFGDLFYFLPYRYVDKSRIYSIREVQPTMAYIQIRALVRSINKIGTNPHNYRLSIIVQDGTGEMELVYFKGIKWIESKIEVGKEYIIFGKPTEFNGRINIVHPELTSPTEQGIPGAGTMMGIYPSTERLKNSNIGNKAIAKMQYTLWERCGQGIEETLPEDFIKEHRLASLQFALQNIHFPADALSLSKAEFRLKFEELFYLQLGLLKQRGIRTRMSNGIIMHSVGKKFTDCYNALPFPLTGAQKRVIKEMRADMKSGRQMNRLLQGDVGSGKTLVALLVSLIACDNGYQACIMAPTEVLAQQHYKNISKMLDPLGIRCALLTGSTKTKERRALHQGLMDGTIEILVGTHAVIEDNVEFKNLGLAVIDEQHRFGVEQRAKLWSKSQVAPHIMVMTATPIPRTLAMTLYGDLDVSLLDELPPGRKPITTLHATESHRGRIYAFMKEQIKAGRQVFIVYPLIKESEKMDYQNLEEGYLRIVEQFPAPEYVTAVVHGKQKNENKEHDMNLFASGRAHILVATSVIEVGVDVPNASVMIIESAERFGLSQLHQLRGRVGRGSERSYCILMTGYKLSKESRERIELMCQTQDGFQLAEADMRMRGPGDLEGTVQSGLAIDLHIANLAKDSPVLEEARRAAMEILDNDPLLEKPQNALFQKQLKLLRKQGKEARDYSVIS